MIIGFTGTRKGMSKSQKRGFKLFFDQHCGEVKEFHHGDCLGSDEEAHQIIQDHFPNIKIVIHPPLDGKFRAFCLSKTVRVPKEYIKRNHDIVDCCDTLFATPETNEEELRSGTWATVRYARKMDKTVVVFLRTEKVTHEKF